MGLIIGLGGSRAGKLGASSYVVAWDGVSEPDVTKIPAGVVVTYEDTSYTGTLAASNDAAGKIYLVSDGTGDEYYRYVVSKEGDTYSWVQLGSTQIDLSDYATKEQVTELGQQVIYDVTMNNPAAGPNNDGKWESLSALLSDANLSTLIPTEVRCGGMSIRFVQSSDNKYVQYRYIGAETTGTPNPLVDIYNWEKYVDLSVVQEKFVTDYYLNFKNAVPDGYVELQSITGNSAKTRIDTGIYCDDDLEIECTFKDNEWASYGAFFGRYSEESANTIRLIYTASNNNKGFVGFNSKASSAFEVSDVVPALKHHVILSKNKFVIDGTVTTIDTTTEGTAQNNTIVINGTNLVSLSGTRTVTWYDFIIRKDGVVVFNGIPCRRESDDAIGMYDAVSNQFLQNAIDNSKAFVGGAERSKEQKLSLDKFDTIPTQGSTNLLKSTAIRESERKINEFVLGNTTGDITKCLHFTNGTASTESNVISYGTASRIISDFIACNQHENAKLVITNASTNPKFDILVGKQKGTNNFEREQSFTGATTIEVNLNGSDRDRLYILLRDHDNTSGAISSSDINGISVAVLNVDSTDILVLNPEVEVRPKIINCTQPYKVYGNSATRNCLNLLHFSDLHADNDNLDRINRFATKYSSYINDIIQTGDLFNYLNGLPSSYASNTNIINTIGNHEARYKVDNEYVYPTTLELYNLIYKDYISQWNVTQPADAATEGKCYFYKDYVSSYVRMIVLDCMHYDTTQLTWLEGVLSDALTNNYHVIIATHISPFDTVKDVNNPFSSLDYSPGNAGGVQSGPESLIKSFINNGGHFICYLCGHIYDDFMGVSTNSDYNNQLVVGIGSASLSASNNYSSMGRIAGDKTQDCFNILSIDTQTSTIKLMRIGADYDRYMRHKGVLSWNYSTSQLIHCE